MDEKTRPVIGERIDQCRKRIEALGSSGTDTAKLSIIFNKIDAAFKAGNVKEENLSEAVKKLENLLQATERMKGRPPQDKVADAKGPAKGPDIQAELASIKGLEDQVKGLGGDLSPIFHHMEALREAADKADQGTFTGYRDTVRPWLQEYLVTLKKARIASVQARVASDVGTLTEWGREDLASPLRSELTVLAPLVLSGEDLDTLLSDMGGLGDRSDRAMSELASDLKVRLEAKQRELRGLLEVREPQFDKSPFREELVRTTKMADQGEFGPALRSLMARTSEAKRIVFRDRIEQLNKLLDLLAPIIAKVGRTQGQDSGAYQDLVGKRNRIEAMPVDDIDAALKEMEGLLDEAARAAAEAEEAAIREIRARIAEMMKRMEGAPPEESRPVVNAIGKVQKAIEDGDVQGASKAMESAESNFRSISRRIERSEIEGQIIAVKARVSELGARGADVRGLEDALSRAMALAQQNAVDESRLQLAAVKKGLSVIEQHADREAFQKLKSELEEEFVRIKAEGGAPSELQARLAEAVDRSRTDMRAALEMAGSIRSLLGAGRTQMVLRTRIAEIAEMIREARALGIDCSAIESEVVKARDALESSQTDAALEMVSKARAELESIVKERTVKRLENEIEIIASEMRRLNLITGDYRSKIESAYAQVEGERIEDAVSSLTTLKSEMERKLSTKRVQSMMDTMASRIREARMHNMEISDYKADLTKAKVRYEAGDIDGAMKDLVQSMKGLEGVLETKKAQRNRLDQVRGTLISLEGKVKRLSSRGVDTTEYVSKLVVLRNMIDSGDEPGARSIAERLESDITNAFRQLPVVSISEGIGPPVRAAPEGGHPPSIEIARKGDGQEVADIDPEEARRRLQMLLTRIGRAVQMGGPTAQEGCRSDLEMIKQLILKKDYIAAYRIALLCMKRLGG